MGAEPWEYFVPYEPDIQAALDKLRDREFQAGRFRGSELAPATIDEALMNMEDQGTASILDIMHVADEPDFFTVAPLPDDELLDLYETTKPAGDMIRGNRDFYEEIERGQGVYIIVYDGDRPSEIFFAGYSFD